jgi:hypothetical protein
MVGIAGAEGERFSAGTVLFIELSGVMVVRPVIFVKKFRSGY